MVWAWTPSPAPPTDPCRRARDHPPTQTTRLIGATESSFTAAGRRHHGVLLLVDCALEDPSLYRQDHFPDIETGREPGFWRSHDSAVPLFPERLHDVIDST